MTGRNINEIRVEVLEDHYNYFWPCLIFIFIYLSTSEDVYQRILQLTRKHLIIEIWTAQIRIVQILMTLTLMVNCFKVLISKSSIVGLCSIKSETLFLKIASNFKNSQCFNVEKN